jgi:hypothetical protein
MSGITPASIGKRGHIRFKRGSSLGTLESLAC